MVWLHAVSTVLQFRHFHEDCLNLDWAFSQHLSFLLSKRWIYFVFVPFSTSKLPCAFKSHLLFQRLFCLSFFWGVNGDYLYNSDGCLSTLHGLEGRGCRGTGGNEPTWIYRQSGSWQYWLTFHKRQECCPKNASWEGQRKKRLHCVGQWFCSKRPF